MLYVIMPTPTTKTQHDQIMHLIKQGNLTAEAIAKRVGVTV